MYILTVTVNGVTHQVACSSDEERILTKEKILWKHQDAEVVEQL